MLIVENHPDRSKYMSLEAVALTPEYRTLNHSQQLFVLSYVNKGLVEGVYDAVAAMKASYGPNIKTPKIRAYQILNNRHVRRVLDLHFHRSELDILLSDLRRATDKSLRLKMLTPEAVRALAAFEKFVKENAEKENADGSKN